MPEHIPQLTKVTKVCPSCDPFRKRVKAEHCVFCDGRGEIERVVWQ